MYNKWKTKFYFIFRISVDDVRAKLSSNNKKKNITAKPINKSNEEDSDDYEFGKEIKDEKKKKV